LHSARHRRFCRAATAYGGILGWLGLAGLDVMDVERLVRDEQEGHVVVLGRAVLHLHPLGKPHETARAEGTRVRPQNAVQDLYAVRTVARRR
jgi:hypothetical protein